MKFSRKLVSILLAVVMMASFGAVRAATNNGAIFKLADIQRMTVDEIIKTKAAQYAGYVRSLPRGMNTLAYTQDLLIQLGNGDAQLGSSKVRAIYTLPDAGAQKWW